MGTDVLNFQVPASAQSASSAVDQLFPLSWLGVLCLGTLGRWWGSRREKDPIEDGRCQRRKENDRQQGISRGKGIQPDRIVGRSLPRGLEIGLEIRKHRAAAHRLRCEKTAFSQRKLLPRQIPAFSAVRRGGFIKQSRRCAGLASGAAGQSAKVYCAPNPIPIRTEMN